VTCQKCEAKNSWPLRARSAGVRIVVDIRCRGCGHEWSEDMPIIRTGSAEVETPRKAG